MPDGDNLSRSLPAEWRGAYRAVHGGPAHLAKYLASITVQELPKSKGLISLEPLASQLGEIASKPLEERARSIIDIPEGVQSCRDTEIARHAAERVLAELVLSEHDFSPEEIRAKLFEEFCIEVPRVYCLGVLQIKVIPQAYADASDALEKTEQTEALLRQELKKTAQELLRDPDASTLTKISKPRRKKPTQGELVATTLDVNLD